ncbi:hypothetical protein ACO2Q0_02620 [Phenylobacterium sp. VNQ135]|uniref:hypothetical protein n=1 Tax=Phenylobacterium sp. VNQ135 TaxID=3400922 RepID=UPI003C0EF368
MTVALVLGGAACVWSDVEAALDLGEFSAVVACNDVVAAWPGRLDAAVSLHPEKFGTWITQRRRRGYPDPVRVIGHENARANPRLPDCITGFASHQFPGQKGSGSSGHFALKFALIDLGCDRAVLCGVPMSEDQAHFFDEKAWTAANPHRKGWEQSWSHIRHRARSMSGWTRAELGAPTRQWIEGGEA